MIYAIVIIAILIIIYFSATYFSAYNVLHLNRQPVPKNPQDYGMEYQNIILKPSDNILLKGWFIPGDFNKIIIMTHVGGLTKYGSTAAYKNFFKLYNEEVQFLNTAKQLHDHGYNVLMFDFRNHGESDKSLNNGMTGVGTEEYKDVVSALDYIQQHPNLKDMEIGFVSFCMGANSTIIAESKQPEKFNNVKCQMLIQPISMDVFVDTYTKKTYSEFLASLLLPMIRVFVKMLSGHKIEELSPRNYVNDIKIPTLYVQAKNDPWTQLSDIEGFYRDTPATKEFFWIENTKHRFESYTYFETKPEKMIEWSDRWM